MGGTDLGIEGAKQGGVLFLYIFHIYIFIYISCIFLKIIKCKYYMCVSGLRNAGRRSEVMASEEVNYAEGVREQSIARKAVQCSEFRKPSRGCGGGK